MAKKQSANFKWITSKYPDSTAFITVDNQLRLYFNSGARNLINRKSVNVGYDYANKRIIIAPSDLVKPANVKPHRMDDRGYTSARPFIRAVGLDKAQLPIQYSYIGKDYSEYPRGAYAFQLVGHEAEDGAL